MMMRGSRQKRIEKDKKRDLKTDKRWLRNV